MKLTGKVAIVTGASSGLGKCWAKGLAREGASVALTSRMYERAQKVVDEIISDGGIAIAVEGDIAIEDNVERIVAATVEAYGGLDILVNNAASSSDAASGALPFYETPLEEWIKMLHTDATGTFMMCKAAFPHMKERGKGKIVNVSSSTVINGYPTDGMCNYVAAKMAVIGMTRQMAREAGKFNINVNVILPGLISTEGVIREFSDTGMLDMMAASRCFKRQGYPEDLMGPLLFLCSDDSDFITGQQYLIDGGRYFM